MSAPSIVGFGGTLRDDSSTERLLREVLTACERRGATTRLFSGAILAAFPHYDPSDPSRTPAQIAFLDAVRGAGGVVIAAPGYHGGASGLVKNAIDLLQDLADAPLPHLDQRPVGLVVSAAGWPATVATLSSLRDIVHALGGWPTPQGVAINTIAGEGFEPVGAALDPDLARVVDLQARQIMEAALSRRVYDIALSNVDAFWPVSPVDLLVHARCHVGELELER